MFYHGFGLLIVGLLSAVLAASSWAQKAGEMQLTTLQPSGEIRHAEKSTSLRIIAWYPAAEEAVGTPLVIGPPDSPLFTLDAAAANAPVYGDGENARYPVILLSHGFGGSARMRSWLAAPLARAGYIVISVDHPGNNGHDPMTVPGSILWWERPDDLHRALAAVSQHPTLGPHLDTQRIGVAGFSAGGFTALALAGGRVDPERMARFCQHNPQDGICQPQQEFVITPEQRQATLADPAVAPLLARAGKDHSLDNVRAVFLMAPGLIQAFTPDSLRSIETPVMIVTGSDDTVVQPDTNADTALQYLPNGQIARFAGAGHYAFLGKCTAKGKAVIPVCQQIKKQGAVHSQTIHMATDFFNQHLREQPTADSSYEGFIRFFSIPWNTQR